MSTEPVAYIVDDDSAVRDALCMLLESVSIRSTAFTSAAELLRSGVLQLYRTLTPREQQVFQEITAGKTNRMVADELGISVRTAEFHRARVMRKMQAHNLADLTLARVTIQDRMTSEGSPARPA
ncbi:MAG: LuxR C-terminal-related transcriptional regulator [Thiocapsa sp.]|jgi:FixJ family two-component response regulator|nr:LuxR C-terminal-related transcriptional regulator [Thiocapsa sp.]MCG6896688.1 LuxR C-terminal-related transcriptional regulator [Thiocapsa sp.]MCG6983862.1 LuxR C-terminal-related transcriptional regulator [Thiocapsa sp.]